MAPPPLRPAATEDLATTDSHLKMLKLLTLLKKKHAADAEDHDEDAGDDDEDKDESEDEDDADDEGDEDEDEDTAAGFSRLSRREKLRSRLRL